MRKATIMLACCVAALLFYIVASLPRSFRYKPVLVVGGGPSDERGSIDNVLVNCPKVEVAFKEQTDGTNYYSLVMKNVESGWYGMLFRNGDYVFWTGQDSDYNRLLRSACGGLNEEQAFVESSASRPFNTTAQSMDTGRYELHDIRNGKVATSAMVDRQTGRVWIWTTVTSKSGESLHSLWKSGYSGEGKHRFRRQAERRSGVKVNSSRSEATLA